MRVASADDAARTGAALARYYDMDLADDPGDIDMYLALADSVEGPLLELAAGSGRVAVPLAAAGHDVVAVDRDAHMLDRARSRWAATSHEAGSASALDLVSADVTTWRPQRGFGLVVIALNSLLLLDREGQGRALATVAASLAPHGRAVIDTWLPTPDDLGLYDGRLVLDWVRTDDETGEIVAKTTSARYSAASRTADITTFFDAWHEAEDAPAAAPLRRVMRRDRISFLTATELVRLAEDADLVPETLAGDYEMGPLADDSDRLVLTCRPGAH